MSVPKKADEPEYQNIRVRTEINKQIKANLIFSSYESPSDLIESMLKAQGLWIKDVQRLEEKLKGHES